MMTCGALMKSVLVAVLLAAAVESGPAGEKLATCCKVVSSEEITDPITGFMMQRANAPCVQAVIFQTERGLFCSHLRAPWVRSKIAAFQKAKALASLAPVVPSPTVSLLSIITSTASPPSSSSPSSSSSSSSSSSEMPTGETVSERSNE